MRVEQLEQRHALDATAIDWNRPGVDVVLIDRQLQDSAALSRSIDESAQRFLYDSRFDLAHDILDRVSRWATQTGSKIDSLSIFSHGSAGAFQLGNEWISTESLARTATDWRQLSQVLATNANIDVYSCDVAASGSGGQTLIDQLSLLTGAEVFASTDLTGKGGDWVLEASSLGSTNHLPAGPFDLAKLEALDVTLGWYSNSWLYRKQITIDSSKVAATQTDFQVVIDLTTDSDLAARALSSGNDILFTSADGTTKLAHEIEMYTSATGRLLAWVKVPTLAGSADTTLYMYYGNSSASSQQDVANVWTSGTFGAVYHLDDSGSAIDDVTSNNFDGTKAGAPTSVTGKLGSGFDLDGIDDAIDMGNNRNFFAGSQAATLSMWVNPDNVTQSISWMSLSINNGGNSTGTSRFGFETTGSNINLILRSDDSTSTTITTTTNALTTGWHLVTAVVDVNANTVAIYLDGVSQAYSGTINLPNTTWPNTADAVAHIGSQDDGLGAFFAGRIDEARVVKAARSSTWVSTEYNNQSSPSTFYTLGSQVALSSRTPYVVTGSYTGNGTDNRNITSVGFQPDLVIIKSRGTDIGVIRTSSMAGDLSKEMGGATAAGANYIQSLLSNGFQVGTNTEVNTNGTVYDFIAIKASDGFVKVGSYTGNGTSGRSVTGLGFSPATVFVMNGTTQEAVYSQQEGVGYTTNFSNGSAFTGGILSLTSGGFTVGTDARVNATSNTYYYVAFNETAGDLDTGVYTGNGVDSTNLTGVGFQPEWMMINEGGTGYGVQHFDSQGAATDSSSTFDAVAAGANRIQALQSDGFQVGTSAYVNTSGTSYAYLALAQQTPATITAISNQTINEDANTGALAFTIDDLETAAASLTVTATSSNTTLIPNANLVLGGSGASRTITATPVANLNGSATITISVYDGDSVTTSTFTITVNAVNDVPVRTAGSPSAISVLEDSNNSTAVTLGFGSLTYGTGGGSDESAQTFTYKVSSIPSFMTVWLTNGTTQVTAGTTMASLAALQGLKYKTVANGAGSGTLQWTIQDSGGTANGGVDTLTESLTVTVTGINDQPVRTAGSPTAINVNEDSANSTAVTLGLGSNVYGAGGGSDESAQTFTYKVTAIPSHITLWQADGTTQVSVNATLSLAQLQGLKYKTVADASGSSNLTWTVQDSGGTANGGVDTLTETLGITVNAVNDAPILTNNGGGATANINVAENSTAVTTATSTDIDGGTAVYSVSGVDAALFSINSSSGVLQFTSAPNYELPADVGANNVYNVTVTVSDGAGGTDTQDLAITVTNINEAGISVSAISGATTEAGGTATFTIVLLGGPSGNVTIGLSSSNTAEGTVSPSSVTFTTANWGTAQTVTVTGVNDFLDDGNIVYSIITAAATSTDPDYSGLNGADVSVTNNDNDTSGFTVTPTSGLTTTEAGAQATFTIVLTAQPTANVTVGISSSNTAEGTVSPSSVTFTAANWNTAQTVTITGVNDFVDDGDIVYSIVTAAATSSDLIYNGINPSDVSVSNTDNDTAGVTVTPTSGLTTTEAGGQATFTIVLNSQPTANVTIGISSSNTAEGTVSPSSVTFTAANWNTAQTITVTGVDDLIDDDNITYTIVTAAATSSDPLYSAMAVSDVSVSNTDNDTAGITVSPTSGLTTTELGGQATFTIVLNTQPTASVTIGLSSSNTAEGTVAPSSVTFTTANWNTPQTITITGVDDFVDDANVSYSIVTAAATSSDSKYSGLNALDVSVVNTDNDTAGITVSPTSGLTTTEAGGTTTFTVVLTSQPTANVTIGLSSNNTAEGTVSASSLTFTAANWNTAQTITITGVDDFVDDGNISYSIVTAAATSSDSLYNGMNAADVSVSNTDNDTAGFTVTPTSGLTTTEAGGTATFTIVLNSQPTADVTIGISSSNTAEGTVSPSSVTFTAANWNTAQTITVTGVNDFVDDGDIGYSIITAAATSSDSTYNGLNPSDVTVTNTDNDTVGFTVTPTSGLTTTEAGGTATFTIVLNSQPTANVTVGLTSSNTAEGTVSPSSVTFTAANWNTAQTITITGVNDSVDDGDIGYSIVTAAATSSDLLYNGINPSDVAVTNTDNDTAGITVTPTSGLTTTEAGGTTTFTIVLNSQPTANVTIGLSSSNTAEGTVSPSSVTFTAANWNTAQTITITGVNDFVDDGDIAYSIVTAAASSSDSLYNTMNASDVSVTNADNDTAGITVTPTSGLTTTEAGGTATFTIVLNSQPTANVTIGLTSSNTAEGTVSPSSVTFTAANWNTAQTITITGVNDAAADGNIAYTIVTAAATSSDGLYSGMNASDVSVTNTDNDTAGITVTPTSGLTTTEAGGTATFTIVLTSQPTANVTI